MEKLKEQLCETCKHSEIEEWTGAATFRDIHCSKRMKWITRGAFLYKLILKCNDYEKVDS